MYTPLVSELKNCEKILPPFLGELGYEIRYFVAYVEPWLRSGWKLLTSRPELYPSGSTISDASLFSDIRKLQHKYRAQPVHSRLKVNFGLRLPAEEHERSIRGFERELRTLVFSKIDRAGRTLTSLDRQLLSAWNGIDDHFLNGYHGLVPSYKPRLFLSGPGCAPVHIGAQFRKMGTKDTFRNSRTADLYPKLLHLSDSLKLPLLIYGEASGCDFPKDCAKAADACGKSHTGLAADLVSLRSCTVMFAPDSGWADLMGWLQIPTIVQAIHSRATYFSLLPFKPIIIGLDERMPLIEQYLRVRKYPRGTIDLVTSSSSETHLHEKFFDLRRYLLK